MKNNDNFIVKECVLTIYILCKDELSLNKYELIKENRPQILIDSLMS